MFGKKNKYSGYLFADLMVALAVSSILLGGFAVSLSGFARFNHYQLVRQRCIAAAQAELDSITVTGEPISDEDFKRLWPKLNVSIQSSPGDGHWQGMELVEVTISGKSFNKEVKVQLSRYILEQGSLFEGER